MFAVIRVRQGDERGVISGVTSGAAESVGEAVGFGGESVTGGFAEGETGRGVDRDAGFDGVAGDGEVPLGNGTGDTAGTGVGGGVGGGMRLGQS